MKRLRILAVDDEQDILTSYQNILASAATDNVFSKIHSRGNELFDSQPEEIDEKYSFELVTCRQGDAAVKKVKEALANNHPFAVAFLDVRMPPGPDGVWTAQQIHSLDPDLNIVIVTGYSDVPPQEIAKKFSTPSKLFYIQKPFHWDEIHQFAVALGENWLIQKELQQQAARLQNVSDGTSETASSDKKEFQNLLNRKVELQEELHTKTKQIEDINIALRVILNEKERERSKIEESVQFNVNEYIMPYLIKLKKTNLNDEQQSVVEVIEQNLSSITSSFSSQEAPLSLKFTPNELQVAKMIKHGHPTKDIAEILNLSILTIESYRKNIRKKMGLTNQKQNLRTALLEYL